MRGGAVHQWAAGASTGDAISSYALALQTIIRSWSRASRLAWISSGVGSLVWRIC